MANMAPTAVEPPVDNLRHQTHKATIRWGDTQQSNLAKLHAADPDLCRTRSDPASLPAVCETLKPRVQLPRLAHNQLMTKEFIRVAEGLMNVDSNTACDHGGFNVNVGDDGISRTLAGVPVPPRLPAESVPHVGPQSPRNAKLHARVHIDYVWAMTDAVAATPRVDVLNMVLNTVQVMPGERRDPQLLDATVSKRALEEAWRSDVAERSPRWK